MTQFNNTFEWDLKVGQIAEQQLAAILEGAKIEVKRDMMAHRTGKVFVEYECRFKPSGIATSTADFWAFVLNGQRIILIPLDDLKRLAREAVRNGKTAKGGDDKASLGALVKLDDLMVVK